MNFKSLSYWLKKTPQPAFVLVDDKRISVAKNKRAYRDLVETIKSLEPSKITCLDAKDEVLRSTTMDEEGGEEKTSTSPEMSDVQLFAKLIAEAYDKGATAQQPIINNAMDFVERQGVRLAKAEAELERLRAHIFKQNQTIAELQNLPLPSDGDTSIMGALATAAIQSGAIPGLGPLRPTPVTPITKKQPPQQQKGAK